MFVPIVGVTVSVTGWPDDGCVGFSDNVRLFAPAAFTVTVAVFEPAAAVTVAVWFVVNCTVALPLASVLADEDDSEPAVLLNVTGTPTRRLPFASSADAIIDTVPPAGGTVDGDALTRTEFVFAAPIVMSTTLLDVGMVAVPPLVPPVVPELGADAALPPADPEIARISATPDAASA